MLHPFFNEGDILAESLSISSGDIRPTERPGLDVAWDGEQEVYDRVSGQ
jgi:hypothetical protein